MYKFLAVFLTLSFAFTILFISAFRTASVKYQFSPGVANFAPEGKHLIEYNLPYPGKVLPGTLLWPLKAIRDKLWLLVNTNPTREAELTLLFADKRIALSIVLLKQGKLEVGISTLTKAEKYLEEALIKGKENSARGMNTDDFFINLYKASLKHYELMQGFINTVPDNARPIIIEMESYPKKVYEDSRNTLLDRGIDPPKNPFNWQ
jgi:hypothetical protein